MAKPIFIIQAERKKSGATGLSRFLMTKDNWFTVGTDNDKNSAVRRAEKLPGRTRVIEKHR